MARHDCDVQALQIDQILTCAVAAGVARTDAAWSGATDALQRAADWSAELRRFWLSFTLPLATVLDDLEVMVCCQWRSLMTSLPEQLV